MALKLNGVIQVVQTGLLSGTRYLALFNGSAGSYTEVDVAGYARKAIPSSGWEDASPAGNVAILDFFDPSADDDAALSGLGIYTASSGGSLLMDGPLTGGAVTLQDGSAITAAIDAITAAITGGRWATAGQARALKGGFNPANGHLYFGLHTAQPTIANELTSTLNYGRVDMLANNFTLNTSGSNAGRLESSAHIEWSSPSGTWSQPTHIGLWNHADRGNGQLLYWDTVDAAVQAPISGATVRIPSGTFWIDFAHDA